MSNEMMIDIDDAVRAQQLKAVWDKYGQWVIGIVAIIIIATAVGVFWNNMLNKQLADQTSQLLTVLQNEADNTDTAKTLNALDKEANFPLKAVVSLYRAQKLEQGKDLKAAQDAYESMIGQKRLPVMIQNLARVHYARLGIIQKQDAKKLLTVLEPVANGTAAFNASAMELKGLLLVQEGKQDEANKIFNILASSSEVPGTLRQRAKSQIRYEEKNAQ